MAEKSIHQIVDSSGQCGAEARSAHDWFVSNGPEPEVQANSSVVWGDVFSKPSPGNKVEFLITGKSYFERVATEIAGAKGAVFIAGWQINYDVDMGGGRTLLHCLVDAIKRGANIYVMPWLAPPGPVDTGYFPTTLAVFHLNAVPGAKGKAYCLPAPAQCDQDMLEVAFAHHQKLVVIDNEKAFMGGMDLAYGRRDDAHFSLKAQGRTGNEFYSSCVPAIKKMTRAELENCVTPAELLAAAFTRGNTRWAATFATSPSEGLIAKSLDAKDAVADFGKDKLGAVQDWWNNVNLLRDFTDAAQDMAMDVAQSASRWAWSRLDERVRAQIGGLHDTAAANATSAGSALVSWISGGDLSRVPPSLLKEVGEAINALVFGAVAALNAAVARTSGDKPAYYPRLFEKVRCVPAGGMARDGEVQPRMPWQDNQCMIQGPAVFELARNFVQRWNSVAVMYETSFKRAHAAAAQLLSSLGVELPAAPRAPRIAASDLPKAPAPKCGGNWVQVLRSAPRKLLRDEAKGGATVGPGIAPQNNCLKAMVKAIRGARQFIYIEGQFFQSDHGNFGPTDPSYSGPMSVLISLTAQPEYARYLDMLEIRGAKDTREILRRMRWAKVDDVVRDIKGKQFMQDLNTVLKNAATVEALRLLGKPQERLLNPIAPELVRRIRRAINDETPFHVYLVLPVHPEGTLDTLNIMIQVHLTMQSLVHGENSLVNGVRRAILAARYRKERRVSAERAEAMARQVDADTLANEVPTDWQRYLTLLNLRNWDTIGGKPVTEQIYVHSKLLIADDQVAVLGSANINDRSMMGDRDSELAVIVTDEAKTIVKLDGVHPVPVGTAVHRLRRSLWAKHFGLESNRPASSLSSAAILDSPAALGTWTAIQNLASDNARLYEQAFWFVPRSAAHPSIQPKEAADNSRDAPPASVWPTWKYDTYLDHGKGGRVLYRMPFDPLFWRGAGREDVVNSWNVSKDSQGAQVAPVSAPGRIQGFITAVPVRWTFRENNLPTPAHIRALAGLSPEGAAGANPVRQASAASDANRESVV